MVIHVFSRGSGTWHQLLSSTTNIMVEEVPIQWHFLCKFHFFNATINLLHQNFLDVSNDNKKPYLSWLSFNKWNTSPHLTYQRLQYICWSLCLKSVLLFFARKYFWPESRLLDECSSKNTFLPQLNNTFQQTKTGIKRHHTGMR